MNRRSCLVLPLCAASLAACDRAPLDGAPVFVDTEAYTAREVLVGVDDAGDGVARMQVADRFGLREVSRNDAIGVSRLAIDDDREVKEVARLLEGDHQVEFAEPNYIARAAAAADDPYLGYQWNLEQVGALKAWDHGTGGGVVVAVLDTGVKKGGPDGIAGLLSGYDFAYGDSDPTDKDGHGTFVAGTIAQKTDNGVGVAGVAPGARVLPVKVLSDDGYGDIGDISNGITWSADQGAQVINMSLGSGYYSSALDRACTYAHDKGVVIVAASGNEFASSVGYPAALDTVIAVGASRYDGSRAGYSNYGSELALLAPGGDLSRDQNGDGYADGILQETIEQGGWTYTFWEGTSMATPHAAAAAALVLAQGDFSPAEVRSILTETARDVGSAGWDQQTGYGVLDIEAAVALAASGGGSGGGGDTGSPGTGGDDDEGGGSSEAPDTTAPTISNVSGWADGSSFTITWVTDEPADTAVIFRDYGEYGDEALTTSHTMRFNGQQGATYTFDVKSTDAAGNTATDGSWYIRL